MTEQADPWRDHVARFRVLDAQVTVLPDAGEMLVVTSLNLLVTEGRQEAFRDDETDQPSPSVLEYFCRVTVDGAEEPQAWMGQGARIVITGIHENGSRITIAGAGVFGRDDMGSLELEFVVLPQMKVLRGNC